MNRDSLAGRWLGVIVPIAVVWVVSVVVSGLTVGYIRYLWLPRAGAGMSPFDQEALWRAKYADSRLLITAVGDCVIILYGLFARRRALSSELVPAMPERLPARVLLWMPFLGAAVCLFVNLVFTFTGLTVLLARDYEAMGEALFPEGQTALTVVTVGLLAPAAEELIFRGVVFPRLRGAYRGLMPAVFSAVLFGAYHGNLAQGLYAFFLGLLFAFGYEKTGWFSAALLMHIFANACSAALTLLPTGLTTGQLLGLMFASGAVLAAGCGRLARLSADRTEPTAGQM